MGRNPPGALLNPEKMNAILQRIIDSYMAGCSVISIAQEHGVTRQAIYYHLKKRDIVEKRKASRSSKLKS